MNGNEHTLASRLGKTVHLSPLRHKIERLMASHPAPGAACVEDWLVDAANERGARIVSRPDRPEPRFIPPSEDILSMEELVVAICQLQCADRPQMLRLAAQFISRGAVASRNLVLIARRERAGMVLAELARQALKVDPSHSLWRDLLDAFCKEPGPGEPLLHWTRLAEPLMREGRMNAAGWRLVA